MINLDSVEEISKLDAKGILSSIKNVANQVKQVFTDFEQIEIPVSYNEAKNICVFGMGGSGLGGRIIDSLVYKRIRVPVEVFNEYDIPAYIGKDSFVIVSSYSGNTEEILKVVREVIDSKASVFIISTGGKLANIKTAENLPGYIYEPKLNPSGMPRMALGYSLASIISLLSKTEFLIFSQEDKDAFVDTLQKFASEFDENKSQDVNIAKRMAKRFLNKVPVMISSEHLTGIIYSFKNLLNENSKTFSAVFEIPEMNHHLLEGLTFPAKIKPLFYFIFFVSKLYAKEVAKRYPVTSDVIQKNNLPYEIYVAREERKVLQIAEILVLGLYVSFYLALLQDIDPAPIPWVDYFKSNL